MAEIIAYASSTRPNHLWSAAQYNSALPKNRSDADIPLVALSDAQTTRQASGDTVMKADVEALIREWQAECADHPSLHNQGNVLLGRLKAMKPSLAMNDFLTGMEHLQITDVELMALKKLVIICGALAQSLSGTAAIEQRALTRVLIDVVSRADISKATA